MKNRLIGILLVSLSFWVLHPFVIEALEVHPCEAHGLVQEVQSISLEHTKGDICDIHAAFHIAFLMPQVIMIRDAATHKEHPHNVKHCIPSNYISSLSEPPKNA